MAETTQTQPVQAPEAGQTVAIKAVPGQDILLADAFDEAEIRMEGGNVVFAFANGGQVVLDFTDLGEAQAPNVIMADGSVLDMKEYLAAFGDKDVEPAAGPDAGGADSGGVGEYRDDAGNLLDGVDKLGVLDPREFTSLSVEALDADNPLEEPIPDVSEPIVSVTSGTVDEKGLSEGTSAGDGSNTTSGSFGIDAGAAGRGRLEIQDKEGNWINVSGGGSVNGTNGVLTVTVVDGGYRWSYELQNNLLSHDDTTFGDGDGISGADDQQPGEAFPVRVFDGNGAVSPVVLLNITVNDDAPMMMPGEGDEGLEGAVLYATLEEESVPDNGGVLGNDEDEGLSHTTGLQTMTGAVNWGADGFGSLVGVQVGGAAMISLGNAESVTVYFDADGAVLEGATGSSAMLEVFSNGEYRLTVTGAMNHAPGAGENWLEMPLITFTGVDGDGDPASVSLAARIQDDVPEVLQVEGQEGLENTVLYANLEEESVPDNGGVIGNDEAEGLSHTTGLQTMTGAVNWGADGFGSLVGVQVGGAAMISLGNAESVTVYFDADGAVLEGATGSSAMLEVFSNGEYRLTVTGAMNHAPGDGMGGLIGENLLYLPTITFTGVDGDGDPASVSLVASVQDDIPIVEITSEVSSLLSLTNYIADAGYNNSFGYYIKDADGKPLEGFVIWDNVKNFVEGSVMIKGYTPDQIGFFIIPNGDSLNAALVSDTAVTFQFVNSEWQAFANGTALKGQGAHVLFDVADLNKDQLDHVKDNNDPGNLNWEDMFRGGDKDYNDVNITAKWTVTQTGTLGEFGADGGRVVIDGHTPDAEGILVVDGLSGMKLTVNTETTEYKIESEFLHSYDTPPPSDTFSFSLVDGDDDTVSATLNAMLQQSNPV